MSKLFKFRLFSNYSLVTEIRDNRLSSIKKNKNGKPYFHKFLNEAFAAACYRMLIGHDHVPMIKMAVTTPLGGVPIGSIIDEVPQFTDAFSLTVTDKYYYQNLIEAGIAEVLVASYIFCEHDLNFGNWGKRADGKLVRIDFESSFKFRLIQKDIIEDLINFPNLKKYSAHNWPYTELFGVYDPAGIRLIHSHSDFIFRKWKCFTKFLLLNKQHFTQALKAYNPNTNDEIVDDLISRSELLKESLINLPEFKKFLTANPNLIEPISTEFENYNSHFPKEKDRYLHINIDEIKANFQSLRKVCMIELDANDIAQPNRCSPPITFELFKSAYLKAFKSEWFPNPFDTIKWKIESGSIYSMKEILLFAKTNKNSRAAKVIQELSQDFTLAP